MSLRCLLTERAASLRRLIRNEVFRDGDHKSLSFSFSSGCLLDKRDRPFCVCGTCETDDRGIPSAYGLGDEKAQVDPSICDGLRDLVCQTRLIITFDKDRRDSGVGKPYSFFIVFILATPDPQLRWEQDPLNESCVYWLLNVTVVPSNLVMLMLNGSA